MRYTLIIEKNKDGFWGQIKELAGVFTFGESVNEIQKNALEAIDLYFDKEEGKPKKITFKVEVDLKEFFEINDFINISKLAKRTVMNASLLRQYAKGIKNPSLKQVGKIERAINEIGRELQNTHLLEPAP